MADIRPFKGYRYALDTPDDMGRFIAPPYDMLNKARIDSLYGSNPRNAVRIDQNRAEPGDAANRARHERAAALFDMWNSNGAIWRDAQDSLYIYEQEFTVERAGKPELAGTLDLLRAKVDFQGCWEGKSACVWCVPLF